MRHRRLTLALALLLALLAAYAPVPTVSRAADVGGPPVVTPQGGGARIEWRPGQRASGAGMPLVTLGGLRVPAELVALRVSGAGRVEPRVETLTSVPWRGGPFAAEPPAGSGHAASNSPPSQALPPSPVVVLRDARLRGARIVVLAISAVFLRDGAPRAVTELRASIAGAAPLSQDVTSLFAADGAIGVAAPDPTNPLAGTAWRVAVTRPGIQRLPAAALAAASVPLSAPENIHLYHDGREVAVEWHGAGASRELRFYASARGDRWNAGDTYWLSADGRPALAMTGPPAQPTAPQRADAAELGVWHGNQLYDSLRPGPDGDHWYAIDLKADPSQPSEILTVPLTPTLPLLEGTTVLTITGTAYTPGQHNLAVTLGGQQRTATWSGVGDWTQVLTFAAKGASASVRLPAGAGPDGVKPDAVEWRRAVGLNVGGRGAFFAGVNGLWQYQLTNTPAGSALYDISDPDRPISLGTFAGGSAAFVDGPEQRRYVLAGPGTLWAPTIARSQPYDFVSPAREIYIAPAQLHGALTPLLARRQAQGYSARAIDVQAIYDAWSFGQVSQEAIRAFLQYAAAAWNPPPLAVTLVGDGTSDPLNYTKHNSANFVPPYLAIVDPWLGETACDACYARLDGPDPTLDPLPDLLFGRLPAKSAAELSTLVSKIVAYETAPLGDLGWRSRVVYIADDADGAGDFAAFADDSAAQQPAGMSVERLYYDPNASSAPWRERDPVRAYDRTVAELNQGAGLVNYIGHGSQYQWATTDPQRSPPYMLGVYDAEDMANGGRLPILLEMTCLTSAFQTPDFGGTIDERLLINAHGGAIAVWGPTGQGVAHGHDWLQRGFYKALWSAPRFGATVGQLTAAGYLELYSSGTCCQDALATFVLLGDPLTAARVLPTRRAYLSAAWR